jgi:hypothetical protein
MLATQREPEHSFAAQATRVLLPTQLLTRQYTSFPKSTVGADSFVFKFAIQKLKD